MLLLIIQPMSTENRHIMKIIPSAIFVILMQDSAPTASAAISFKAATLNFTERSSRSTENERLRSNEIRGNRTNVALRYIPIDPKCVQRNRARSPILTRSPGDWDERQ